jgi:hypothetical protein
MGHLGLVVPNTCKCRCIFVFWLKRDSVANERDGRPIGTALACTNFLFWLKRESVANELNGRPIGTALGCAIFLFWLKCDTLNKKQKF